MNTISCACDSDYKLILGIVASRKQMKVGDLVKWSLDTCLEGELKEASEFFYASASSQKHTDVSEDTDRGE